MTGKRREKGTVKFWWISVTSEEIDSTRTKSFKILLKNVLFFVKNVEVFLKAM